MGKQKKQRRKPHKENPTGLPSVKDFQTETEDAINEDREIALRKVYEEVQSPLIEEKLSGLQTLESMSCDSMCAVRIAKDGIAKIIGPLLIDTNVLVRSGSASALRCIAEHGKVEAYESLVKDDIMTPLCALLKQYYVNWQPESISTEKNKINDEKEALIQAVTLLWTLCENNEQAVKCSNNENVVSILTKFFDVAIYGMEIATITVQCLLSISDDNSSAIKTLKGCEDVLLQLLNLEANDTNTSEVTSLKTATTGLLINLTSHMENSSMGTICKAVTVLSETLSIDCKPLLSNLTSIIPHAKNNVSSSARKKVQESRRIFGAQQQALEILANICSDDQENDGDMNSDDSDYEADDADDVCMDDKLCKINSSVPLEIIEVFNSCNIVEKIWEKTVAVDKDTEEILEQNVEGKAILRQMHTLKCRAYLCLNNLLSSLEIDMLGGMENVFSMCINMGKLVFKEADPNDIELLESATAAMRAALERLSEAKANMFNELTLTDIEPVLNGERQCSNANVRANLIRILANFALILMNSNTPEAQELIKNVSIFLLNTCLQESEAWIIAEALDAIMDIYSEDESDQLAIKVELVKKLHHLVSIFKTKVRQQKKILGDNIAIVSTVNANIRRFIKYKEKRIKHA